MNICHYAGVSAVAAMAAFATCAETTMDNWTVTTDVTLTEDTVVTGALSVDGGTIDLAGHKLTVKGGFSMAASAVSGNNIVSNPSFENGFSTGSYGGWSDSSHPTDWTKDGSATVGCSRNGQPWIRVGVPDGIYACYLQNGGTAKQDLTISEAGYYEVSFAYAVRADSGFAGGVVTLSIDGNVCYTDALARNDSARRDGKAVLWLESGTPTLRIGHAKNPVDPNNDQSVWVDMISIKKVAGSGNAGIVDTSSGAPGELRIEMASGDSMTQPVPVNGNMTASYVLTGDADWTAAGTINLTAGVLIDLNGHKLKVANVTGPGVVIDNANAYYSLHKAADGTFYVEADYLQTNVTSDRFNHASEWINTGYVHNENTVVDMKVQITEGTTDWYCYYGARNGTATALGGWIYRGNHYMGVTADAGTSTPYPSTPFDVHMEFGGTCTFGDFSYESGAGGSCSRYDYLFAMNNNGGPGFGAKARVFYCLVREKNGDAEDGYDVMRDFVPVKRLSDNVCGMFDRQNKKFYSNNGGGAFTIGSYATAAEHEEFGSSGVLQIAVPANTTLSLDDMAKIVGDVKVIKDGAGVLTYVEATSVQTYFHGGYEDHSAPVIAVWTGMAGDNDFSNAQNWSCTNDLGSALSEMVPDATTSTYILGADADWTAVGVLTLSSGKMLDMNGHSLTVANIMGDGIVVDAASSDQNVILAPDGAAYQKILYVQATQDGANNTGGLGRIQYVDTGYYHDSTTKVDIRVEFQDVGYGDNYGYAVFYGCRYLSNSTGRAAQLGGWIHSGKFYYYDTDEHDGSAAKVNTIYDVHLDKGGSSYANYADGTRAANLGTGNGKGPNTWGTDYIFSNNQVSNGGKYWPCRCRVYSCKVYEGEEPMRDFVPVICVSGANAGKAGFWCTVTEKFYGNSGYGQLTAGPVKKSEFAAAGSVTLVVAEDEELSLAGAPIYGNIKVVKAGTGTLAVPTTGVCFTGGIDVLAGTLALAGPVTSIEGLSLGNVTVASGAKASVAATHNLKYGDAFTLDGGTLELLCSGTEKPVTTYITNSIALNAGAKIRFDTSTFAASEFLFSTDAFVLGEGVESAVSCVELSAPDETVVEADGENGILVMVMTAPITAVWTGAADNNEFADPGNWRCTNILGGTVANAVPDGNTVMYILDADADWTSKGPIALASGVTLDLAGHNLTVANITGSGMVVDTTGNLRDADHNLFADTDGTLYLGMEYIQSTGTYSGNNYNWGDQYIDTGYHHNKNTVTDIKVAIIGNTSNWYCYYGSRDGYNDNQFGGWIHGGRHYKGVRQGEGDLSRSFTLNVPFVTHLEQNGPCTIDGWQFDTGVGDTSGSLTDFLFAVNHINTASYIAKARMFYCVIQEKEDGNLVVKRNFRPARRIKDGKPGMFDVENGEFYVNQRTGSDFALGPVKKSAYDATSSLTIKIAEGETISLAGAPIYGNIKVVKAGAGILAVPTTGMYFTGGIDVQGGLLQMGGVLDYTDRLVVAAEGAVAIPAPSGSACTNNFSFAGGRLTVGDAAANIVGAVEIGGAEIAVSGEFKPVEGKCINATMLDGSTLDLSGMSGPWNAYGAVVEDMGSGGALAFADNATVKVKIGSRRVSLAEPIVTFVDANGEVVPPSNYDTLAFRRGDSGRAYQVMKRDNGIYIDSGFVIFIN